jgi:Cu(I)/Ag(I) efflux system membrane protein CusA/SilA
MAAVQETIAMALGAAPLTTTVEGRERYDVVLRYPQSLRADPQAIAQNVRVATPGGAAVPLGEIAAIALTRGPTTIRTEGAEPVVYVFVDIRGRDLGGYVEDARRVVAGAVDLPTGYSVAWSGQFEYLERAKARLMVVVPATLLVIAFLLYLNFRRIEETLIVLLSLPFALTGGLWLMHVLAFNMSVAAAVGFIALAGVAAETGVVMLIYLDHALADMYERRAAEGRAATREDLRDAIISGAVERVRPKIMTVAAIMAALVPILWSTGAGSEVMQRIAVPMIGGMASSTLLTLVVIPVVYALVKQVGTAAAAKRVSAEGRTQPA